jgi:hypothetical protein
MAHSPGRREWRHDEDRDGVAAAHRVRGRSGSNCGRGLPKPAPLGARPSQNRAVPKGCCQAIQHPTLGRPTALRQAASTSKAHSALRGAMRTRSSPGCRDLGPALRESRRRCREQIGRRSEIACHDRPPTSSSSPSPWALMGPDGPGSAAWKRPLCTEIARQRCARQAVASIEAGLAELGSAAAQQPQHRQSAISVLPAVPVCLRSQAVAPVTYATAWDVRSESLGPPGSCVRLA